MSDQDDETSADLTSADLTSADLTSADPGAGEPDADAEIRRAIEAVVMVAEEPMAAGELAQLLEVPVALVEAGCAALAAEYERDRRGFVLARVAGGYRYQSHPDMAPYLERFALDGQSARLSAAALETLAIVAYKQPVSRAQIALIRGVNVDGVIRTLTQRGYITDVGVDPGPGQALLYGTTERFLESVGLDSLHDLPPVADFVPGAEVMDALEAGLGVEKAPRPAKAEGEGGTVGPVVEAPPERGG